LIVSIRHQLGNRSIERDLNARLGLDEARERREKLLRRARVAPNAIAMRVVEAAGARGDPDLAIGRLPVDDDAARIGAFHREDTLFERNIQPVVLVEGAVDAREHRLDSSMEIRFRHNARMIRALAAATLFALLAAGCGQKGPLKLPDPPAQPATPAK